MPAGSTLAPHYKQSNPGACLPACVRMVLAALGGEYTEAQVAATLGCYEFGTPANRVTRLTKLGYRVQYGPSSLEELDAQVRETCRNLLIRFLCTHKSYCSSGRSPRVPV